MIENRVFLCLDVDAEIDKSTRMLPHWAQSGAATFVTFRTVDSMPYAAWKSWQSSQREYLDQHGFAALSIDNALARLNGDVLQGFKNLRNDELSHLLDLGYGECHLKKPEIAKIVAERVLYFDGVRYDVDCCVIMPNHVHLLMAFRKEFEMRYELELLLRYSARMINKRLGLHGAFWQAEPFDHVIRSDRQFESIRNYIRNNPIKANLPADSFLYWESK